MKITLQVKFRGVPGELEIEERDMGKLLPKQEMTQKEAADFLGVTRQTISNRKIPKNKNGKYSLKTLQEQIL